MKIDLVYTYVDGNDIKHKEKKNVYSATNSYNKDYNQDIRYESINEIYYSVKTALKYLDFINKIYIVTDDQIPLLDSIDSDKVIIVDHSEIIPPEYLPTFNSDVIESCLHKIKNLTEIFLYNNDDCFFLDYIKINDIVSPDTKLNIINNFNIDLLRNKNSEYSNRICYTYDLIETSFKNRKLINNHHTKILRVNTLKYLETLYQEELHKLRLCKFRIINTIQYLFLAINMDTILRYNNIIYKSSDFAEFHFGNCDYNPSLKKKFNTKKKFKFACFNSMNQTFITPFSTYINHYIS